jgi:hypothetical protein
MQSLKLMFLGFLIMLAGISWLFSLGTALPGDGTRTINPLVQAFYSVTTCSGTTCTSNSDVAGHLAEIVRVQEAFAGVLMLCGLGLGYAGYFRKEPSRQTPTPPAASPPTGDQPPQP